MPTISDTNFKSKREEAESALNRIAIERALGRIWWLGWKRIFSLLIRRLYWKSILFLIA